VPSGLLIQFNSCHLHLFFLLDFGFRFWFCSCAGWGIWGEWHPGRAARLLRVLQAAQAHCRGSAPASVPERRSGQACTGRQPSCGDARGRASALRGAVRKGRAWCKQQPWHAGSCISRATASQPRQGQTSSSKHVWAAALGLASLFFSGRFADPCREQAFWPGKVQGNAQ